MKPFNEEQLIQIHRHLHTIPELALKEHKTQSYLEKKIKEMNQTYLTIRHLNSVPTALMVHIQGSDPNKTIGYRADMDALPIQERTNLSYQSKHAGIMHACGHDIHMTVGIGILSYFADHQPKNNMVFFFQPAEESQNGGKLSYENGAFQNEWRPDEFYALHDNPSLPAGSIGIRNGTLAAGTTEVNVDFYGKSGHAAYPEAANDMIVAEAQFINQIQTIISRNINPTQSGVITFGKLHGGTIRNIIADHVRLEGTIRGLKQSIIKKIDQRLEEIGKGIELSFGSKVKIELNQGGYLPVENDSILTKNLINFMEQDPDTQLIHTEPSMAGEDFGYLLSKIPGTMFWLGVNDDSSLHSATFTPDESAIYKGVQSIIRFLKYRVNN